MGDSIIQNKVDVDNQLLNTRLCVDLSENIHIHYRDLRLEFSKKEFGEFFTILNDVKNYLNTNMYEEGISAFKDFAVNIDERSAYFPNRLQIELLRNGTYHIHYNNMRLELTKESMVSISTMLSKMVDTKLVSVNDIQVTVCNEKNLWDEKPITESPNYLSLQHNDMQYHEAYSVMLKHFNDEAVISTTNDYVNLIESLDKNGIDWNDTSPIRVGSLDNRYIIIDGHHRMCYILYKFKYNTFIIQNNIIVGGLIL